VSAFDDLTLGEVDEIQRVALGGKQFSDEDANPLMLAGGVMWAMQRRDNASLTWEVFKAHTKMSDIKQYSEMMQAEEEAMNANPLPAQSGPLS
jgi:hypothetical protein